MPIFAGDLPGEDPLPTGDCSLTPALTIVF